MHKHTIHLAVVICILMSENKMSISRIDSRIYLARFARFAWGDPAGTAKHDN